MPDLTSFDIFNPDTNIIVEVLESRQFGDLSKAKVDPTSCLTYLPFNDEILVFDKDQLVDTISPGSGSIGAILVTSEGQLIIHSGLGMGFYDSETESWDWNLHFLWDPVINRFARVKNIKEHVTGEITFETSTSIIKYKDGNWSEYDNTNSPIGASTTHIIDSEGNIVVGVEGGIYRKIGRDWEFTALVNPANDFIADIVEDDRGNYWVATFRSGLLYWNGFTYTQYNILNSAIPSNQITGILPNPVTNDLWLICDRGIAVMNPADFNVQNGVFGKAYYDSMQNSEYDAGDDVGISNVRIELDGQAVLTDANGNYGYYLDDKKSVSIQASVEEDFQSTSPEELSVEFKGEDVFDVNFGMWKMVEASELELDISLSPFLCSSDISAWITIKNPGWKTVGGTLDLTLQEGINLKSTVPEADHISGNTASWSFANLSYLEQRSFYAIIRGPSVEEFTLQDTLADVEIDVATVINYDGFTSEYYSFAPFLCAYDPNDKLAESTGLSLDKYSLIGDDLVYTIRFQNEGNYKATNVVITDTLSSLLNLNTLEIVSSSHLVQTQLKTQQKVAVFRFLNIDLPPKSENEAASQGYIKFKVSPVDGVQDYTHIFNSAAIYFDNNSPIITNATENILVDELPLTDTEFQELNLEVRVAPNPSDSNFELFSDVLTYDYVVYDITGSQVLSGFAKNGHARFTLDLPGLYIVTVSNGEHRSSYKITKI